MSAAQFSNRGYDMMTEMWALAGQAFSRATGVSLVEGNHVRLLRDACENYPAWLDAIGSATRHIHFENYIIREDNTGRKFADALIAKAREGVRVRLIYDWMGGLGRTSRRFWNRLRAGGVEVRCYNPPRFDSPLGWLSRDHRKMLAIDGQIGFITGLCVGRMWEGIPEKNIEPWRDTGVEVRGAAVADIERAFAQVWAIMAEPIPEAEIINRDPIRQAGGMSLRVVASVPATANMFRLDQLVAALARERIWLTDAYYAGTTAYVQALRAAAKDGVDVHLYRGQGIVRSWKQVCASSSGTARCCTRRPRSPTGIGRASVRPISTSSVGSATASWMWWSKTNCSRERWKRCTFRIYRMRRKSSWMRNRRCARPASRPTRIR